MTYDNIIVMNLKTGETREYPNCLPSEAVIRAYLEDQGQEVPTGEAFSRICLDMSDQVTFETGTVAVGEWHAASQNEADGLPVGRW